MIALLSLSADRDNCCFSVWLMDGDAICPGWVGWVGGHTKFITLAGVFTMLNVVDGLVYWNLVVFACECYLALCMPGYQCDFSFFFIGCVEQSVMSFNPSSDPHRMSCMWCRYVRMYVCM